jgi:hypothetical protein
MASGGAIFLIMVTAGNDVNKSSSVIFEGSSAAVP